MMNKNEYVLGVDLGTSYFKLGLFNPAGKLCGLGRVFVPKETGDGTRAEVPVERFWALLKQGVFEACQQANAQPEQIRALAYASQANSFLLLDQYQQPLTPLILWSDQRAQNQPRVTDFFQKKDFLTRTGLGIDSSPEFCVAKLHWIQQEAPELWRRATRLLTMSDYFTWSLTHRFVGDAGTASLLGLLDLPRLAWLANIVDLSGIQLSAPLLPGSFAGTVTPAGAEKLGIVPEIPFALGSLDHHVAAIGAGTGVFAEMSESTGTVLACLCLSKIFEPQKNICTGAGLAPGEFYQVAFDGNGAGALEWYQQNFTPELSIPQLEQLAAEVPIGSAGLNARPSVQHVGLTGFLNLRRTHKPGHFTRAIFESTAASLLQLVRQLSGRQLPSKIVATGGGARSDLWLQIKADLLGVEFLAPGTIEPACQGAAMLAALAAGWFSDLTAVTREWVQIKRRFEPRAAYHEKYQDWFQQNHPD